MTSLGDSFQPLHSSLLLCTFICSVTYWFVQVSKITPRTTIRRLDDVRCCTHPIHPAASSQPAQLPDSSFACLDSMNSNAELRTSCLAQQEASKELRIRGWPDMIQRHNARRSILLSSSGELFYYYSTCLNSAIPVLGCWSLCLLTCGF